MKRALLDRAASLGLGQTSKRISVLILLTSIYAAVASTIYLTSDLGEWSPEFNPVGTSLLLVIGFFFMPSLFEELLWRWLLIPPSCLGRLDGRTIWYIVITSLVFTAGHPVAAYLFVPHAKGVFLQPSFLIIVFLLGLTCGTAYVVAKSIWPSTAIHWLTVLAWKFLLGGPFIMLGR